MDHEARRRLLLSCPMFGALSREAVDDILEQATERFVRRHQVIFHKGDAGSYMVAVLSGRMRISATSPEGREVTLNMIGAGEVFGELALLDGKPRSAGAIAAEDSHLMLVERRHFMPHVNNNQHVSLRLIEILCERLRATSETLGDFVMRDLQSRLARKLLALGQEYGATSNGRTRLSIKLSHTDLGHFVGCSRETVNKQMRAWEEAGIVARDEGRIALCQPCELKRIADGG